MGRGASAQGRIRAWGTIALAAAGFVVVLAGTRADGQGPPVTSAEWKVIVHPANSIRSIAREELERIYRKRSRFWRDGAAILPVNLPSGDPLRRAFTEQVLRDDEEDLATYWNRQYFQGTEPPVVLQSSKAVLAYVAATVNAIGYVRADDVDESVAVVEVTSGR